jgi:hypothetical protein
MLPTGASDVDAAERVSKALDQPRRLDPEILDYFRVLLSQHFTADKMLGPRRLLAPVLAQIQILEELRRHSRLSTMSRRCGCSRSTPSSPDGCTRTPAT